MGNTVKFGSNKKTKTVALPSYDYKKDGKVCNDTEILISTSRTIQEQRELVKKYPNAGDPKHEDAQKSTLEMIKNAIISWNFTDENNNPLEITEEILDQLEDKDFLFLLQEITGKKLIDNGKVLDKEEVDKIEKNV